MSKKSEVSFVNILTIISICVMPRMAAMCDSGSGKRDFAPVHMSHNLAGVYLDWYYDLR